MSLRYGAVCLTSPPTVYSILLVYLCLLQPWFWSGTTARWVSIFLIKIDLNRWQLPSVEIVVPAVNGTVSSDDRQKIKRVTDAVRLLFPDTVIVLLPSQAGDMGPSHGRNHTNPDGLTLRVNLRHLSESSREGCSGDQVPTVPASPASPADHIPFCYDFNRRP